jgi:hypothetical protein
MKVKPLLFLIHRWLGVGMCLLFALWFASGIVMMYVEYPELTVEERLENLPALEIEKIRLSPFQASKTIRTESAFSSVKLTSITSRPAYKFESSSRIPYFVYADTGELFSGFDEKSAVMVASFSGFNKIGSSPSYEKSLELDQWTVSAGLDQFRPLHKVNLNDAAGTELYISDKSGQVVRDTHRSERFWNWLGSTIHWIYPVQLRKNAALWNDVIVYISVLGVFSVVTGGIIGFMRIRVRSPYQGKRISPYRGWMKWHHIVGLCSLVFVSTFIFSGLMSMGPWGVFSANTSARTQMDRYTGGDTLQLSNLPLPEYSILSLPLKEIEWHKIQNQPYYTIVYSLDKKEVSFSDSSNSSQSTLLLSKINEAIPQLLPSSKLLSMEIIQQPDDYYYSRHNRYRPFPVYRAKFDDPESTWYHIDLASGEIVNRVTDASRRERWLYNGLHSLDFQFLLQKRPMWDLLVILLSLIGFVFSLTSVVIGWRRLIR